MRLRSHWLSTQCFFRCLAHPSTSAQKRLRFFLFDLRGIRLKPDSNRFQTSLHSWLVILRLRRRISTLSLLSVCTVGTVVLDGPYSRCMLIRGRTQFAPTFLKKATPFDMYFYHLLGCDLAFAGVLAQELIEDELSLTHRIFISVYLHLPHDNRPRSWFFEYHSIPREKKKEQLP